MSHFAILISGSLPPHHGASSG